MGTPDWNDLKVLLSLASGGSIAGAARDLGVDAATIGRRLTALGETLETPLILREGQRFSWTPAGRTMLAAAEAMRTDVERACGAVRAARIGPTVTVVVSCPSGLSASLTAAIVTIGQKYA